MNPKERMLMISGERRPSFAMAALALLASDTGADSYPMPQPIKGERLEIARCSTAVGRNDLCPCGSGKKFKKCCRLQRVQR